LEAFSEDHLFPGEEYFMNRKGISLPGGEFWKFWRFSGIILYWQLLRKV